MENQTPLPPNNGESPVPLPPVEPIAKDHTQSIIIAVGIVFAALVLAGAYVFVSLHKVEAPIIPVPVVEQYEHESELPKDTDELIAEAFSKVLDVEVSKESEFAHSLRNDNTDYSQYYQNLVDQPGVEWFTGPVEVGDLQLFKMTGEAVQYSYGNLNHFQYWQLGTINGTPLYVTIVPWCEMGCVNKSLYFLGTPEGQYELLLKYSDYEDLTNDFYGAVFATSTVQLNDTTTILAFDLPKTLMVGSETLVVTDGEFFSSGRDFFANSSFNTTDESENRYLREFVADTEYGPLFRLYRDLGNGETADVDYAIRLPGGLEATLSQEDGFIGDDRVPLIQWLDGTSNTEAYRTDGVGSCGGFGSEVMLQPISESSLELVGHTYNEIPVYSVIDPGNILITRLFTDGDVRSYYEYNEVTGRTEAFDLTKEQFIAAHGVLIFEDSFGIQHTLTNTKYGPQAECAKPVVYLYPETPTTISVSLDALVTKSDPLYEDGWTVLAYPSGELHSDGEVYEYLFWDGYGNGEYPVFDSGFVVPTSEAMSLMREHLATMGFNEKEISDFAEFWTPHLPEEPYTRFSWIGTLGMERLAKLSIEPVPDTMIRAFIDFKGLSEYESISPQTIPHRERRGYVVTEWGGLLRE
ncbi:MAG: hypothetical protein KC877_02950 [Candidatus Kaiserbacteria bacterium]|nr:hypothetical protein [Candidatus Kaiserbacteria bacterium]MCB9816880.1 hypothetical protein [Candidatus Nomurabacteria bacterium]